jgi:uncharacterized protein YbbC (DUF1343 family)
MGHVMRQHIDTGLDILVSEKFERFKGKRVAILANQASVDKNIDHIVMLALKNQVQVVKLFAPEHGFSGFLQDMEHVGDGIDQKLKIPVISLYGDHKESLKLKAKHLLDVDILLCDLQDIGSRYYTFHCTIAWAMAACQESKTRLVVIDRPNPINSEVIEGNLVKKTHFSFVGAYPLPNRHGFTLGELVYYVRNALNARFDVEIVWMEGYRRSLYFDEIALPFISPSPNMPTVNTAVVYPGMCLIEGTNLSEGRGTCTPFELIGAPYINDSEGFKEKIDNLGFKGVTTRACHFKPKFHKHKEVSCGGIFTHVTDRKQFTPLRFALGVITVAMGYEGFDWRHEPYEFEHNHLAIDLLLGDAHLRDMLERRAPLEEIFILLEEEERYFTHQRREYLHYPRGL